MLNLYNIKKITLLLDKSCQKLRPPPCKLDVDIQPTVSSNTSNNWESNKWPTMILIFNKLLIPLLLLSVHV